jgi:hypothetical protein
MDVWFAVLRVLHVFGTFLWIGVAVVNIAFVVPAAGKIGPDGAKFLRAFLQGPLIPATNIAIGVTALSGLALYWRDSNGLSVSWTSSGEGIWLTIGALFGLAAAGVFGGLTLPTFRKVLAVGAEIQSAGGPPRPELVAQLGGLQARSLMIGRLNAALLLVALFAMVVGGSF